MVLLGLLLLRVELLFFPLLFGGVFLDFYFLCSFFGWCCVPAFFLRGAAWFLPCVGGIVVFLLLFREVVFLLLLQVGLLFHLSFDVVIAGF